PQPAAPTQPAPLTDSERKEYGEEFIDVVSRVALHAVQPRLEELGRRLAGLEGRVVNAMQQVQSVATVTEEVAFERYYQTLDREVPAWRSINHEQRFLDWLEERDIFRLYQRETGSSAPAAPTPAPQNPVAAPPVDPNSLVAPDTAAPPPPPSGQPTGRVWKQSEVDRLYDDKAKGRITEQRFRELEKDYLRALAEGRVVAGQ
ncbi:hypothetical protein LPJ08_29080, partial [Klebsiella pneumoniae]|nr:hypothetical protein [Klebsiella pneumoniae]